MTVLLMEKAMLRELKRGGQVFFLHNEVETIENVKERLEELMPEALQYYKPMGSGN